MRALVIAVVTLTACTTGYGPKGIFGHGYEDEQLGPNRYVVRVSVNAWTKRKKAMRYAYRRADELCPQGYHVIDREHWTKQVGNDDEHDSDALLEIECSLFKPGGAAGDDSPLATELRLERTGAGITYGTKPVFCTTDGDDSDGTCFANLAACNAQRTQDGKTGDCPQRDHAACYSLRRMVDGSRHTACAVSLEVCEARRDHDAFDQDLVDVAKACGEYRVKAAPSTDAAAVPATPVPAATPATTAPSGSAAPAAP